MLPALLLALLAARGESRPAFDERSIARLGATADFHQGLLAQPGAALSPCDRLAGHPSDPDKVGPGIEREAIDVPAAIAACEAGLRADPKNARFEYQLGRLLFYSKQTQAALPHLETSAKAGHRQAEFVLGYIHSEGLNDLPKNVCIAEPLWRDAAGRGHFAARVSYARLWIRGRWNNCPTGATDRGAIERFLESARKDTSDYYQGLLIDDLRERLASMPGPDSNKK